MWPSSDNRSRRWRLPSYSIDLANEDICPQGMLDKIGLRTASSAPGRGVDCLHGKQVLFGQHELVRTTG